MRSLSRVRSLPRGHVRARLLPLFVTLSVSFSLSVSLSLHHLFIVFNLLSRARALHSRVCSLSLMRAQARARSLSLQVSFPEYRLFYRALLQKRPIILRSLLSGAAP